MWHEAVRADLWDGVATTDIFGNIVHYKAPKYLFDRPEYVEIGGGSVKIGINKIALAWIDEFATDFPSSDEFELMASRAFRTYNAAFKDKKNGKNYGECVVAKSHEFPPLQTTPAFP